MFIQSTVNNLLVEFLPAGQESGSIGEQLLDPVADLPGVFALIRGLG
ncbi:hypothetical protein OS125_06580 [Corynebacterium sp. P7003]|uniref:Uncharacterized protein n=1 Tax=Corynebacterium pygosceleis TaxID=2800406 RepID=A0ABT3WRU7_9CORY|nr:hypothetical protein [Corynebacterium pygosceleis]MCX7444911.1 hypothetical protein [Corynebacterium pygosceleis]